MSMGSYTHLEECAIKRTTAAAVLVLCEDEEFWVPRSVLDNGDKLEKGDEGMTLTVPDSLLREKGLSHLID